MPSLLRGGADSRGISEAHVDALISRAKQLLGEGDYRLVFQAGLDWCLTDIREDLRNSACATTAPRASEPGVAAETPKPAETKPKYDFYSVLPEMEVVVPEAEIAEKVQQPPAIAPNGGERYLLQAGSFRTARDGEELKAKLAMLGLRANVVSVNINGATWHRVRVGPYATARELDEARRTLSSNGISAIALKETQ